MSEPKTILVVDDDVELSDGLRMVLEKQGHRVIQARDGQQGQRLVYQQRPDLVILDMMMPRMGGYPVLEHFRGKPDAPPIIMITANEGSRHKAYAEYLGVVDYIRKPFAMERLLEAVERGLKGEAAAGVHGSKRVSSSATAVPLAATVLLARGPGSPEGFLVRRAETLRFMGGFHAFPGGRVLPADAASPTPRPVAVQRVAAVRELFEETGVLLARRPDGSFPADAELAGPRARAARRRGRLSGRAAPTRPDDSPGRPLSRRQSGHAAVLVGPLRHRLFHGRRPPATDAAGAAPASWTPGNGSAPTRPCGRGKRARSLISPPTASLLETIRGRPVEELARRARPLFETLAAGSPEVIFFSPQVQMIPLFCNGLPPTYYTNAFLVGHDPAYLIDPGPAEADEQRRLFTLLDARREAGARLAGVLLTHHHPDHVGAAGAVARRYGRRSSPTRGRPGRWRARSPWAARSTTAPCWTSARRRTAARGGWRRSTRPATRPATSAFTSRRIASFSWGTWRPRCRRW